MNATMRTDQKLLRQRRQASAILIVGVIVVLISLFFGLGSLSRFRQAEATWEAHNARATAVANALENFNRHTGYGGFIHNFKNLVLRRDLPRYQQRIEADIAGLRADLDLLDTLINAPGEKAALAQLRATFEEYATNYAKVHPMVTAGTSSDEIDAVVKVDDGPALAALSLLKTLINARAEQAQQLGQATHADALRFAWIGGGLMMAAILAAILAIVGMMLFQRRLITANEIIRKTQERFRDMVNTTDGIVWEADATTFSFTFISHKAELLLGYPAEAWYEPGFWVEHLHPEDKTWAPEYCASCTGRIEPHDFEYRFIAKDGRTVWLHDIVTVVAENNAPRWLRGIMIDITERKQADAALVASEERWKFAIEGAGDGLWDWNIQTGKAFYSPRYKTMLGFSEDEIGDTSDEWSKRIHPGDAPGVFAAMQPYMDGMPGNITVEFRMLCKDGRWQWTLGRGMVVQRDASGKATRMIGTNTDISARKQAEATLKQSEQRFRQMSEAAGAYLWEIDTRMVYTYISNLSVNAKGYTPEELLGHTPMEFMPEADIAPVGAIVDQAIANRSPFKLQHRNITPSGEVLWEEVNGTPFCDEHGVVVGLRGTGLNITERKQLEDQIRQLAYFDALTGLANRRMLDDHLHQAMAISKRSGLYGALMFMDLDNFKPLNDAHGHDVGDLLLIEVATRLRACLREVDTVARLGGDEFVVVLAELTDDKAQSTEQAMNVAEKIRASLAAPYQLMVTQAGEQEKWVEHHCSASIGVVLFIGDEASQTDLMKWADTAMYQAKETGRNKVRLYHPPAASLNTSS